MDQKSLRRAAMAAHSQALEARVALRFADFRGRKAGFLSMTPAGNGSGEREARPVR